MTETGVAVTSMKIISVNVMKDLATQRTDGTLTQGQCAEILGDGIEIVGNNETCGIVLKNKSYGDDVKLLDKDIVSNTPRRLLIIVPVLLIPGEYKLTISTQFFEGDGILPVPQTYSMDVIIH